MEKQRTQQVEPTHDQEAKDSLPPLIGQDGFEVQQLSKPASGDVIVQIDNNQVTDTNTLGSVLATHNPGDTIAVHIYRGNQQLTINVKLGELQAGS